MTRDELYTLVWESPVVHLAKRLGISNTRLKKICDDYEVPVPPPGYWAKRAAGKPIDKPELPDPTPSIFGKLNSALRRIGEVPLKIADNQIAEFDPKFVADHESRHSSTRCRKVCIRTLNTLRRTLADATIDDDGFVSSASPGLPIVRVSPHLIDRAAFLIDRLISVVHQRGHKVIRASGAFRIAVADETFELKVYETRQRIDDRSPTSVSTPLERRRFRASGKLGMEISDPREFRWSHRNFVGQWHDRRDKPLEAILDVAVAATEAAAQHIQYCRMRAHDQERRLLDEQARAERASQEAEFLERHYATYRKLLELEQFAAFLMSTASPFE